MFGGDDDLGWFKNENIETTEETLARVREVLRLFKEMAKEE